MKTNKTIEYIAPECRTMVIKSEGIICSSQTDYGFGAYDWEDDGNDGWFSGNNS